MDQFKLAPYIKLEPYAIKLKIDRRDAYSSVSLDSVIINLVQELAERCMLEKGAVIGHIKGFVKGPDETWFRVSLTDGRRPAEFEGNTLQTQDSIELTLNVHVIGVTANRVGTLLKDTIFTLSEQRDVTICSILQGE